MRTPNRKPIRLKQIRLADLATSADTRLDIYRRVLDRRISEVESGEFVLKIPSSRGVQLRLPGKEFHATPEIFFQEDGATHFTLPCESFSLRGGEAAVIPARLPHGEVQTGEFLNIIYMVQPEGFSFHVGYFDEWVRWSPLDRFAFNAHPLIVRYAEELCQAYDSPRPSPLLSGLYLALLARLRDALHFSVVAQPEVHLLMQRCREGIDAHFTRLDFSVAWLARQLGCSAGHLSRMFCQQAGVRLIQALHAKRVEYAKRLLQESDMNIAETAWACGFSHPSYFDRIFRSYSGETPKQFREGLAKSGIPTGVLSRPGDKAEGIPQSRVLR